MRKARVARAPTRGPASGCFRLRAPSYRSVIAGVGLDLHPIARMARGIEHDAGVRDTLFTPAEIEACEGASRPSREYAVRFAAKEALLKALGAGVLDLGVYREVEALGAQGARRLRLHGRLARLARRRSITRLHLSTSCTRELAAAWVVLESGPPATTPLRGGTR